MRQSYLRSKTHGFMYQGPIVQNNEEIEGDLKLRIQEGWIMGGTEECFGCYLSQKVSLKIKKKLLRIYKTNNVVWN